MITYDWELGEDLNRVLVEEKLGHMLPPEHKMPILIIPLTTASSFISVSANELALCTGALHGPPHFEGFDPFPPHRCAPTAIHYGRGKPLWTAWARPFRVNSYFVARDCIYLIREDGVVVFIEADVSHHTAFIDRSSFLTEFDYNISGAFACLFDKYCDTLCVGNLAGPGGIWKVWF